MNPPAFRIRTIVTNFGWLAAGESVAKLCSFAAFAYIAGILGPSGIGLVEYVIAILFVMTLIIDFGFDLYGAREIAKDRTIIGGITHRVIGTRVWLTLLSVIVVTIAALSTDRMDLRWLLILFGLSLLPAPLLLHWVFKGCDLMHVVSVAQVLRYGTFAIVVFATIRDGTHVWLVPIAEIAGVLVAAAFTVIAYRRFFGSYPSVTSLWPDRRLIGESLTIGASQFMWAARYVFVTVLLWPIATEEEVGLFGIALRIVVAMHMFVSLYISNLLPTVSRSTNAPRPMLRSLLSSAMRASSWISIPLCIVAVLCARPLITAVYGPAFDRSVGVLQILVWMLATALLSAHHRVTLIAYGRQKLELLSTGTGAVLNIILIFVLYRPYGILGVAAAMLIGELVTLLLAYGFVEHQVTATRTWRALWPPTGVAMTATLAAYAVSDHHLWLQIGVAISMLCVGFLVLERRFIAEVAAQLVTPKLRNHRPVR